MGSGSCLGNLLWFIFGGFLNGLGWIIAGGLCCLTIVGIPFGQQCFKIATFTMFPFGKEVQMDTGSSLSCLGNIIWIVICGWSLFLANLFWAILWSITII